MVRSGTTRRHTVRSFTLAVCLLALAPLGCARAPQEPARVGIVVFGDSRLPQLEGFLDGLRQLGYESGRDLTISIRNAGDDRSRLRPMVEQLLSEGVHLLVAAGGLEADAMREPATIHHVPVLALYVTAITERKLVDHRRLPGWEVTGVDNLNAELSEKRVGLIADLLPDARRILVLYYENIAPSRLGMAYARRAADKLDLYIDARAVTSREQVRATMQALAPGEVDAVLMVPTAPIDSGMEELILPHAQRLGLPVITHSDNLVRAGALAGYGADTRDLGVQAARLADKILHGVKAGDIPFETPKRLNYILNTDVATSLSLSPTALARSQINRYLTTSAP